MVRQICALIAAVLACACGHEASHPPSQSPVPRVDVALRREIETIQALVPRRATLDSLLRQHELSSGAVKIAVQSAAVVFNPRQLRANRPYKLVRTVDGLLREFEYQIDDDRFLRLVSRDRTQPSVVDAQVLPYIKDTRTIAVHGQIDADHPSLIAAIDETGERIQFAIALAQIFSGEIDFESDLQAGDTFEVLFEKSTHEGQFAGYGAILCARFNVNGRDHEAFRWVNPDSRKAGYYDESGRSLKRFFLATPLRFSPRVTSGFSRSRLHPVYRTYRPHLGVDYAAPAGAQVVAVANGVVVSAGWAGGGGNQIRLRHASRYESYYLHLSSFAKGIRAGSRVTQGQLIGRVGSTGTATGPHLDYRLRKGGAFVNPRFEHARMPPGEPIPSIRLADFRTLSDAMTRQLSTILLVEAPKQRSDAARANQ